MQRDQYQQGQRGSYVTRAYFGELQASIEQDINQPVRQEIDAFFCAFGRKLNNCVTR